ncbi:MAG: hypothetical protein AB7Q97_25745 [Gammaproteobacteria bacterium]
MHVERFAMTSDPVSLMVVEPQRGGQRRAWRRDLLFLLEEVPGKDHRPPGVVS